MFDKSGNLKLEDVQINTLKPLEDMKETRKQLMVIAVERGPRSTVSPKPSPCPPIRATARRVESQGSPLPALYLTQREKGISPAGVDVFIAS